VFDAFLTEHGVTGALAALLALLAGGFAKGVVGFALPLVALSGMGIFLPYETALALLIFPTLVSNALQATRNGLVAAWESAVKFWRLLVILVVMIGFSAQLVVVLSDAVLFTLLGGFITIFGILQLVGWQPHLGQRGRRAAEVGAATLGGFFGGISGIWGPPVILYLLAAAVEKVEMVRVQALAFLAGSLVLVAAHVASGVINPVTAPMGLALVVPTVLAMFLGYLIQDRLDQVLFRRITLIVLVVAGVNLLRRGLLG
jgi:uncharacterized membrane protein YfcA